MSDAMEEKTETAVDLVVHVTDFLFDALQTCKAVFPPGFYECGDFYGVGEITLKVEGEGEGEEVGIRVSVSQIPIGLVL